MVRRNQTMQLPAYQLGESTFLKKPSGLSASRIVLMLSTHTGRIASVPNPKRPG